MDNNIKNSLLLVGSAIGGGYGGSWAAQRLCAAMSCNLGPWGPAIGAMLGAMAGTALTKSLVGDDMAMPEFQDGDIEASPAVEASATVKD